MAMNKEKLKGILSEEPADIEADDGMEYGSADADAVLDAIQAKDGAALADALKAFVRSCSDSGSDDDSEE